MSDIIRHFSSSKKIKEKEISTDWNTFSNLIYWHGTNIFEDESITEKKFIKKAKDTFKSDILNLIKDNDFEFGYSSSAESYIKNYIDGQESLAKSWLNEVFIDKFHDKSIIEGILHIISHFDFDTISPEGPTMALAGLTHKSAEVKECAVRAFENWGTQESLRILKSTQFEEAWLTDYINEVVEDLREVWASHEPAC